ncbi:MAG: putative O-glycosylation ligase, exosortase A system-associated [Acetobacteraceae bacterium]|jgi:probable O-glycosylation ligase (exosortase A-associated)|nr:putative O-glycosylation ligase, exosortase A system-associated [Acetobacteraceae bacterium]
MLRSLALSGLICTLLAIAVARPFVGVMVWSWISFMNPHREVYGFASTMPWAMLTFLVTIVGCFVAREPRRPAVNAVTIPLLLFGIWVTLTSLVGIGPPEPMWQMWDKVIKVIAGLLLTAAMLTDRRRVDALIWLMVISLGFYGVKGGLFTLVTGGGHIVVGPHDTMIGDRNHLSVALLVTLPLMNYLRLQARHGIVRLGLVFAMATTLFSVVGSQSRGALVGLVATAGVFWLRSRGKVVSGIAIVIGVALAIAFMPESWVERMETMRTYDEDASAMGRVRIWLAAIALGVARPLTGGGFQAIYNQGIVDMVYPGVRARATHSIWLEVLADHGFPGLFIWLAVLGGGIWYAFRMVRLAKDRPELRWAGDLGRMGQVSAVAYMSGGTFLSLSYWDFFLTLLVVLGAAHAVALQTLRQQATQRAGATPGWRAQPTAGMRPAATRA